MLASLFNAGLYVLVQALVLGLLVILVYRGAWRRLKAATAYLFALFLIDGLARRYVLHHFGLKSLEYYYFYWFTDMALTLGAFLLVCTFFRRACMDQGQDLWKNVRLMLLLVFILVLGYSAFSLFKNYNHLFSMFMFEFQQNLYFCCLVLNTLLYILMARFEVADEELGLFVTGMGVQFAGPAATFALKFLTPNSGLTETVMDYVGPICTMGMLSTWVYAVALKPKRTRIPASAELVPVRAADQERKQLRFT